MMNIFLISIEWDWIDNDWKLIHYTSQSNRPYYVKYACFGLSIIMIELYEKSEITNIMKINVLILLGKLKIMMLYSMCFELININK